MLISFPQSRFSLIPEDQILLFALVINDTDILLFVSLLIRYPFLFLIFFKNCFLLSDKFQPCNHFPTSWYHQSCIYPTDLFI